MYVIYKHVFIFIKIPSKIQYLVFSKMIYMIPILLATSNAS